MLKAIRTYLVVFFWLSAGLVAMGSGYVSDTTSTSSDSADGLASSEAYPSDRISPFYDINPFAYDTSRYTEGDIVESAWRGLFGSTRDGAKEDPLYTELQGNVRKGESLADIFQTVRNLLRDLAVLREATGSGLELDIAKKILYEVDLKVAAVLATTPAFFFRFLEAEKASDFVFKVCHRCAPISELEALYSMVKALDAAQVAELSYKLFSAGGPTAAVPTPTHIDLADMGSWGPLLAQCLRNMGKNSLQTASDLGENSEDFIVRVCNAQHVCNAYEQLRKLAQKDFQAVLEQTFQALSTIQKAEIPAPPTGHGGYARFLAQALYNIFGGKSEALLFLEELGRLQASGLAARPDVWGAPHDYFYRKYYVPALDVNEKLSLINTLKCRSQEFLDRFEDKKIDDKELHVFAFNVGQGNCIILRHGNESAIIDAGKGNGLDKPDDKSQFDRFVLPKITALLRGTQLKAVFITHPHTDHYNLLWDLIEGVKLGGGYPIFLGGAEQNWNTGRGGKLGDFWKQACEQRDLFFVTHDVRHKNGRICAKPIFDDIFRGTTFEFILPVKEWKTADNTCSFFLKVCHSSADCSFLFTGDAEGQNLDHITGHVYKEEHSDTLWKVISPEFKPFIQRSALSPDKALEGMLYKENRRALRNIAVAFAPHHGTGTKGSQTVLSHLSNLKYPPALFVVSSVVTGKDQNPPESTIRMVGKAPARHGPHAVTFHKGDQMDYKFTRRRIYTTEAAPGGAYWFKSDGKHIELYSAYPNEHNLGDIGFLSIND